ncbi:UDP-N-acetylmuramoyl-L-alanine--D-glutamate ligase [Prochlorococcus sp. MIT 1341]|uniref:UDP-N-acetylmuramoyl-L-alanine--D-glutamate ligase n=1 Tax=Prochlorococcus sp. MIT 1341 TaxID=3096221 RepID=UPI002A759404|nr:UDP-N-acetylmuramoyl-L-alanine--D-glutamate ligase [Prochlorococcus sp. MIT 1341]
MSLTFIIGLGISGMGAARLLNAEGRKVIIFEQKKDERIYEIKKELEKEGIQVEIGEELAIETFIRFQKEIQEIIISPGVEWDHQTLNQLRDLNFTVKGEMSLAWQRLNCIPWIGITGTNGKTTVTYLLNHILESNGIKAPMGGNVGIAASEVARKFKCNPNNSLDWVIMEMSSYQIEASSEISPKIGIWTNLSPDHLERHKTLEKYRKIKRGLIEKSEIRIFNWDDIDLRSNKEDMPSGIWVSTKEKGTKENKIKVWVNSEGMIVNDGLSIFHSSTSNLIGEHNLQNILLVTATALEIGLCPREIEQGLKTFPGVPHRLEKIGEINGIEVFNDSKATNFDAAKVGISAIKSPSIVLAGGQQKKGDPSNWLNELQRRATGIVLFGKGAHSLHELIKSSGFSNEVICCESLANAVKLGIEMGLRYKAKAIILSPACASFDQYKNFEERGDHFRELIGPSLTIKGQI